MFPFIAQSQIETVVDLLNREEEATSNFLMGKSMKNLFFFLAFVFTLHAQAVQEFETIVTDTRFNSSSRVVIDKEEIQKSHAKNVTDLLASQANISIAQSNFTPTSIYLRGGDSSHVLILVDGVPYYDASTIQRTINLNSLDLKSIQKIEIIKGSQSVLYGGQALTGVIKIETIPSQAENSGQLLAEAGNWQQSAVSGGVLRSLSADWSMIARGSYSQKKSTSPVLNSTQTYSTKLGTAELAAVYNSDIKVILKTQTSFDKTYIPTTAFPSYRAADADNFETSTYQLNNTGVFSAPQMFLKPLFSVSQQRSSRQYEQDAISGLGFPTKQDYVADVLALRFEVEPISSESVHLKVGGNYAHEKMVYRNLDVLSSDESSEFEGFFAKADFQLNSLLNLEAGLREDFNQMKNKIDTYQLGLSVSDFLKLEYSTGFKQPSLFQLFSSYGNTDLKPEKSTSSSVTVEQNLTTDLFTSITAFENQFENLILIKGSPQRYENVTKTKTIGFEALAAYRFTEQKAQVSLALGYQEPKDLSDGNWLVRRPLRTASLKVRKEFIEKLTLGLELIHNGDRRDKTGSTTYGTLNSYTLVHSTVEYKQNENLAYFVRGQNLFNQRYESSFGFYDEGLNVLAGVEFSF